MAKHRNVISSLEGVFRHMADDYGTTAKLNGTYLPGFDADAALIVFPEAVM
jgi:hypothetical protein